MNGCAPNSSAGSLAELLYKEHRWSQDQVPHWELLTTDQRIAWEAVAAKAIAELGRKPAERPVSPAEYELLHSVFVGALSIRDKGLIHFNRLPPDMRLAITTLAARYRAEGYGDDGLPKKETVEAIFKLGAKPVSMVGGSPRSK